MVIPGTMTGWNLLRFPKSQTRKLLKASTTRIENQTLIAETNMAKNTLTKKLEKILSFYDSYLPEDGIPMFQRDMKEVIELSKQYKKGGS